MEAELISILGALIAIGIPAIGSGYAMQKIGELSESLLKDEEKGFFSNALIFSVLAETPTIYGLLIAIIILISTFSNNIPQAFAALLAGVSVGIPGIAAAYSIGLVGQASLVAIHEKKKLFGKTLILTALPEVIAIYGLIVSLLILSASGAFGNPKISSMDDVGKIALVSVIISLTGIIALFISRIAVSAVKSIIKNEGSFFQSLIIAVLPESIALYALLVCILILSNAHFI